jgi:hypothetical protein
MLPQILEQLKVVNIYLITKFIFTIRNLSIEIIILPSIKLSF